MSENIREHLSGPSVRSRLETRNPCNMEPYDDAMSAACAALQRMIQSSLDMPIEDQPTLDRLLAAHQYHFGDISDWPNDICWGDDVFGTA